jgi:aspartokinase-like uncharacterized kinase
MNPRPTVVKVGGSLFDLPDLGARLGSWLEELGRTEVVLVPGGGSAVDRIRRLDAELQLGEEKSHWLAVAAMSMNAKSLAECLDRSLVVAGLEACRSAWSYGLLPVLDVLPFLHQDETQVDALPHRWSVTSDALAGRVAEVFEAEQLVLLKSVEIPSVLTWHDAAEKGLIDATLPQIIDRWRCTRLVRAVNLRTLTA